MVLIFAIGTRIGTNYVPLLVFAAMYACYIAYRCGFSWPEIEEAVGKKIGHAAPIFAIFLVVGMLMGALIYCGTVPMLIYYGTKILSTRWLYLCAFLLCGCFSVLTGTSHGSIGTAGLAMISMGQAMPDTNLPMLAGAVICGAVVGDKISPFSDTTLMAALVTDNDVYDHVGHQAKTVVPAAVISVLIYFGVGLFSKPSVGTDLEQAEILREGLNQVYHWSPLLLLPAVVVVVGAITKKPTLITILIAAITAITVGLIVQDFSLSDGITCLYSGFNINMVNGVDVQMLPASVKTICNRGGMTAFTKTFFVAFICYFFASAAELAGALRVLLDMTCRFIKNTFSLVLVTGVSMITMNCLCGSSTPSASVMGPLLKPQYEALGLHSLNLAREIEDFGTGSTAFIPCHLPAHCTQASWA